MAPDWRNSVEYRWNKSGHIQGDSMEPFLGSGVPLGGHQIRLWPENAVFGRFGPFFGALWHTQMALTDPENCSNASPGMCPDLFHPCSTLFHQFGATRLAYGPKRPFLAVLDPVWPYIWPKWLEQEWSPLEQVNPYQKKAKNIIGCHGKPTSKKPPSLGHVNNLPIYKLGQNIDEKAQFLDFES